MSDRLLSATTLLVSRFRRQRPLRGGSLLVTIFGDAIAPRGGAVTLESLIGLAAPFGLNERLVRTAMARLATSGWLENRRLGRLSEYQLSREGRARFAAATQHIYGVPGHPWLGCWTIVLIPSLGHRQRRAARQALSWAGFGEPTPGVFVYPAPRMDEFEQLSRRIPSLSDAIILTTAKGSADSNRQLVKLGWDLGELSNRYRRFVAHFEPLLVALCGHDQFAPLPSFLLRTLLIHEYRKIHLRDPLLPAELLPTDWAGTTAYRLCRSIYGRVTPAAEQHLSDHAATLDGPLPPANSELGTRFGGLVD